MAQLRQELPKYKVGDIVSIDFAGYYPNLEPCEHCHKYLFMILWDGTIFCSRCKKVVGKLNKSQPEPEPEKKATKSCEKHDRFIPSCKACIEAKNSTGESI